MSKEKHSPIEPDTPLKDEKSFWDRNLLPCPFCGGMPEWVNLTHPSGIPALQCPECQFKMQQDRRDKTFFYWNRRTPLQPVKDEGFINKINCLIGYLESWSKYLKPPQELRAVIDEANEWVATLSSPPEPSTSLKEGSFEDYIRIARNSFVQTIVKYFPHEYHKDFVDAIPVVEIRVVCEDILIAYDQMRERLSEPSSKEQEAVCSHCGDIIEHPLCRNCEIALTLPDNEY